MNKTSWASWSFVMSLPLVFLAAACQIVPERPAAAPPPGAAALTQAASPRPVMPPAVRETMIQKVLASASTLPVTPILRIDTGTHIRAIHALALSPRGNLLATASVDRTVRVWDRQTGEAREVLRPPGSSHRHWLFRRMVANWSPEACLFWPDIRPGRGRPNSACISLIPRMAT